MHSFCGTARPGGTSPKCGMEMKFGLSTRHVRRWIGDGWLFREHLAAGHGVQGDTILRCQKESLMRDDDGGAWWSVEGFENFNGFKGLYGFRLGA